MGQLKPAGGRFDHLASQISGHWQAILGFNAETNLARARRQWIDWSNQEGHGRLSPITNNSRFLLPHVSHNDDRWRVQSNKGVLIVGIYRRLDNRCFMKAVHHESRTEHGETADFKALMAEAHRVRAIRFVSGKRPSLKTSHE